MQPVDLSSLAWSVVTESFCHLLGLQWPKENGLTGSLQFLVGRCSHHKPQQLAVLFGYLSKKSKEWVCQRNWIILSSLQIVPLGQVWSWSETIWGKLILPLPAFQINRGFQPPELLAFHLLPALNSLKIRASKLHTVPYYIWYSLIASMGFPNLCALLVLTHRWQQPFAVAERCFHCMLSAS